MSDATLQKIENRLNEAAPKCCHKCVEIARELLKELKRMRSEETPESHRGGENV